MTLFTPLTILEPTRKKRWKFLKYSKERARDYIWWLTQRKIGDPSHLHFSPLLSLLGNEFLFRSKSGTNLSSIFLRSGRGSIFYSQEINSKKRKISSYSRRSMLSYLILSSKKIDLSWLLCSLNRISDQRSGKICSSVSDWSAKILSNSEDWTRMSRDFSYLLSTIWS